MNLTKNQIIEKLIGLNIEHDPKASKDTLATLLPAEAPEAPEAEEVEMGELTGDGTGQALPPIEDNPVEQVAPAIADSYELVQLTRNAAGHQVGETFNKRGAAKLGILEHCKPFTG